jgi:hypothetical protein
LLAVAYQTLPATSHKGIFCMSSIRCALAGLFIFGGVTTALSADKLAIQEGLWASPPKLCSEINVSPDGSFKMDVNTASLEWLELKKNEMNMFEANCRFKILTKSNDKYTIQLHCDGEDIRTSDKLIIAAVDDKTFALIGTAENFLGIPGGGRMYGLCHAGPIKFRHPGDE